MAANLNIGILRVLYLTASPIPSATQRRVMLFHTGSFSDQKADFVSLCVQQVQMNSLPGSPPCSKHTSGWGAISLESRSVAITASGWWHWAQGSTSSHAGSPKHWGSFPCAVLLTRIPKHLACFLCHPNVFDFSQYCASISSWRSYWFIPKSPRQNHTSELAAALFPWARWNKTWFLDTVYFISLLQLLLKQGNF